MHTLSTLICLATVGLSALAADYQDPSSGYDDPTTRLHTTTANLFIVDSDIAPDGFTRLATLAGSRPSKPTFPGPAITANKGNTFKINVTNQLSDPSMMKSTSVHFHGINQEKNNWADGPVGITQCPIAPGNSFLYTFKAPDQTGTYWYHAHYGTQYCDGLRGPLVIYDKNDPFEHLYDVDNESTIIALADWYHTSSKNQPVLVPDSTLINGLGRYAGGPPSALAVIRVRRKLRYRFRIISMSCDPNFVFSIDGHNMTIIETDGINTQRVTVDSIEIFVGQRYSFILHANQPVDNYWIRANPNKGHRGFDGGINSAILRYVGAPEQDPTTTETSSVMPLVETNLHPLDSIPVPGTPEPGKADVNLNLAFAFDPAIGKWTINGAPYTPPSVPVLMQIMSGAKTAQELLPANDVYLLPRKKSVEITINGLDSHPFHLHGHVFSVVRSAGSSTYNFDNPIARDVVATGVSGDNVTIRFETDNPGPWILHCHIVWHLNKGLAVVLAEDVPDIPTVIHPSAAWTQLCPIFDALSPDDH